MFSLESPHRGHSNKYTQYIISQYKKENHPKLSQICNCGICFKGPKNEPSVFEPLKFCCNCVRKSEVSLERISVCHAIEKSVEHGKHCLTYSNTKTSYVCYHSILAVTSEI